jgi:hypothetical protein
MKKDTQLKTNWEERLKEEWAKRIKVNKEGYVTLDSAHLGTWLIPFIHSALAEARGEWEIEQRKNIGMLRQWLNEERITDKKMVTNEDIELFLLDSSKK